jgi:hypothetical protein
MTAPARDHADITPAPTSPAMSVEYSNKAHEHAQGTPLESEADTKAEGNVGVNAAVPIEHGGLSQYELANDPHR